jgi:phage gp29-like protein
MPDRDPDIPRRPRVVRGRAPSDLTSTEWTVGQVRSALRLHVRGDFSRSALLADACRGDDRIKSDLRTRVYAVTGLPFRLDPSPTGDQRRAKAVAAELAARWPSICPASTVRQVLRWGVLQGVSAARVEWTADAGRWWPSLEVWHPQHLRWQDYARRFEAQSDQGLLPVEPGDGSWLLHQPEGDRGWMDASIRGLAIPYLLRGLSRRDWARFSEKHGLPITGAVGPEGASTDDKDDFFDDLRALGSEGIVMLPKDRDGKGFDLTMVEPKNFTAWQGFEHVLYHCDVSIAVELLGQASNAQEGGSYAKAVALAALRQDLLEADAAAIAETIHRHVLRPWAMFNYGDAELAPVPCWDATPPEDAKRKAETWQTSGAALATWQTAAAAHGFEVDFEAAAALVGMPVRRAPTPGRPPPAPPQD